jgi:hypothetical protein
MQHPTFGATLAEQHRDELSRQAREARLVHGSRPNGRPRALASRRWWRPATRPARA